MMDTAINAICSGQLDGGNISYQALHQVAGRDRGCYASLGHGRAILRAPAQLDQYLHSYGPMTQRQWSRFLPEIHLPRQGIHLVDYGCGQGLGGALLLDHFGHELRRRIQSLALVEASPVALARAAAVYRCYCGTRPIQGINKRLDQVQATELAAPSHRHSLHLLSNVLDIDTFDLGLLLDKMLASGRTHSIFAVSFDRDKYGGTPRFRAISDKLHALAHSGGVTLYRCRLEHVKLPCGRPAVTWEAHLELARER